jgi:hypothetical protein
MSGGARAAIIVRESLLLRETPMLFLAILLVALTVWFYAAAAFQFRGYEWFDATCRDMPTLCASPDYVAIAAVVAIVVLFVIQTLKKSH